MAKSTTKRARQSGGGRKPTGPQSGNVATITARITQELRDDLDRESRRNRMSLSQEIQKRLAASLKGTGRKGLAHMYGRTVGARERNGGLAQLVGILAARIEDTTGKSWREDRYTFEALTLGVSMILAEMAPDGAPEIPEAVAKSAARHTGSPNERLRKIGEDMQQPEGTASMIALGLFDQLQREQLPPPGAPKTELHSEEKSVLPRLRRALNLKGS